MNLINAIENNNFDLFQSLIEDPIINVNESIDNENNTALHLTVQKERFEMTKLLLEKGANVNAQSISGTTPIIYVKNNIEILKLLLNNGANVHIISNKRLHGPVTPLLLACAFNYYEVIEMLLDHGADLNQKIHFIDGIVVNVYDFKRVFSSSELPNFESFINLYNKRKEIETLWVLIKNEFDYFIQWFPKELVNDLLDLLTN